MPARSSTSVDPSRGQRVLARLRHRQLQLALDGRYRESALYARRAQRVHWAIGGVGAADRAVTFGGGGAASAISAFR